MIVKIQLPLAGSSHDSPCLIYNKDRTVEECFPAHMVAAILYGRPKAYFEAHINSQKQLVIGKEVKAQAW